MVRTVEQMGAFVIVTGAAQIFGVRRSRTAYDAGHASSPIKEELSPTCDGVRKRLLVKCAGRVMSAMRLLAIVQNAPGAAKARPDRTVTNAPLRDLFDLFGPKV